MLRLPSKSLPNDAQSSLNNWQSEINEVEGFAEQVKKAKTMFGAKNRKDNPVFQKVRGALKEMQGRLLRCAYCEDSVADEVEHIYPKNLYPDKVFVWENYCYACGPCNGPKRNRFVLFLTSNGNEEDVTPPPYNLRPSNWKPVPPPKGEALLINPRAEDPLEFLWLDLGETFRIEPVMDLPGKATRRAEHTLELLDLNRDFLIRARENSFIAFRSMLERYAEEKLDRNRQYRLREIKSTIQGFSHRTVWKEMVRQRGFYQELNNLFDNAPEALNWPCR